MTPERIKAPHVLLVLAVPTDGHGLQDISNFLGGIDIVEVATTGREHRRAFVANVVSVAVANG